MRTRPDHERNYERNSNNLVASRPGGCKMRDPGNEVGIVSGKCDTFCYFRISNFLLSRSRNEGSFRDHQDHSGVSRFYNFSCDLA